MFVNDGQTIFSLEARRSERSSSWLSLKRRWLCLRVLALFVELDYLLDSLMIQGRA